MLAMLDLTNDGYMDEPGTFVVDSWSFPAAEFGVADARKVSDAVNAAYLYRVCPCGKYLIKDDAAICLYCQMTATPSTKRVHFCPICCDEGREMHMTHTPCCRQFAHTHCLATWHHKSGDERCPFCRQQ